MGIEPRKIAVINAWKETLSHFLQEEQLFLKITDQMTKIGKCRLSNKLFEKSIAMFGESLITRIIMAVTVINACNKVGVGLKMEPEF